MPKYHKNPVAVSRLSHEQYRVTQRDGTERPFENAYWDNKQPESSVPGCIVAQIDSNGASRSGRLWRIKLRNALTRPTMMKVFQRPPALISYFAVSLDGFSQKRRTSNTEPPAVQCSRAPGSIQP